MSYFADIWLMESCKKECRENVDPSFTDTIIRNANSFYKIIAIIIKRFDSLIQRSI